MKSIKLMRVPMLIVSILLSVMASGLYAQTPECNVNDPVNGDRMKCKHGKLIEKQQALINSIDLHFGNLVSIEDLEAMQNAQDRAKNAKDRAKVKHYKNIGKKSQEPCEMAELPKDFDNKKPNSNGNGICEHGERCLEVNDDEIGDDDSICKLKGNKKEVCACVEGTGEDVMDDEVDLEYQADLEDAFEETTNQIQLAIDTIEKDASAISARSLALHASADGSTNPCAAATGYNDYDEILTMTILKQAAVTSRGVTDILERGCDQTGAGFNFQAVCIIAEGVTAGLMVAVETVDGIFKILDQEYQDVKNACLMELYDDVQANQKSLDQIKTVLGPPPDPSIPGGMAQGISDLLTDMSTVKSDVKFLKEEIPKIQTQITDLETLMIKRFDEVKEILLTPHGLRDKLHSDEAGGKK